VEKKTFSIHPAALGAAIVVITALAGVLALHQPVAVRQTASGLPPASAGGGARHKQLYQSSMHPWIVQDHPGTCPICGMDLVAMSAEKQAAWEKNHPS
jgi:Cu(I)/Ag(I) efflux system membrane fusion protein